jgi:hypothetical protein
VECRINVRDNDGPVAFGSTPLPRSVMTVITLNFEMIH